MFKFRETVFSGKNAIKKNVEEKTFYLPKAGSLYIHFLFFGDISLFSISGNVTP